MLAWQGLVAALSEEGIAMSLEHLYACEIDASKRRWILEMFPGSQVFQDALELEKDTAKNDAGEHVQVPQRWRVQIAGFPCKAASSLNVKQASTENRSCIMNETLTTGSVFGAIRKLAAMHLKLFEADIEAGYVTFMALENVLNLAVRTKGLQLSNLEQVVQTWVEVGWICVAFHLSPEDFGVLVSRPRLWIVPVPRRCIEVAGLTEEMFRENMHECTNRLIGFEMEPLASYLLPDDSEAVQAYLAACQAKEAVRCGDVCEAIITSGGLVPQCARKSGKKEQTKIQTPRWVARHEKAFTKSGGDWTAARRFGEREVKEFPGLAALTDRQVESLELAGVTEFPEKEARVIELKHSNDRCRLGQKANCILPGGQQYLTHKGSLMLPWDALGLQSLSLSWVAASKETKYDE